MADLDIRAALRPMVDHPAADRLPVSELARRVRHRRLRRRSALAGLAVTLAVAGSLAAQGDPPQVVTTDDRPPATAGDPPAPTSPTTAPDPVPTASSPSSPTSPTTTAGSPPSTSAATDQPASDDAGLAVTMTTTSSWENGHCVEVRVENTTAADVAWEVRYAPGGTVATLWNAVATGDGTTFVGEGWNARLPAGKWTTFGVCIDT